MNIIGTKVKKTNTFIHSLSILCMEYCEFRISHSQHKSFIEFLAEKFSSDFENLPFFPEEFIVLFQTIYQLNQIKFLMQKFRCRGNSLEIKIIEIDRF